MLKVMRQRLGLEHDGREDGRASHTSTQQGTTKKKYNWNADEEDAHSVTRLIDAEDRMLPCEYCHEVP